MYAGESLLDPRSTRRILDHMKATNPTSGLPDPLTGQEQRILSLLAQGMTNKEIAATLFLSEKTVRNYVSHILSKLGVSNRAEAAAFAVRYGLGNSMIPD